MHRASKPPTGVKEGGHQTTKKVLMQQNFTKNNNILLLQQYINTIDSKKVNINISLLIFTF